MTHPGSSLARPRTEPSRAVLDSSAPSPARHPEHRRPVGQELLRQQEAFWQRQKRQSEERQALRRQQRLREVRAEVAPAAPLARAPPPPRGPSPSRESRCAITDARV